MDVNAAKFPGSFYCARANKLQRQTQPSATVQKFRMLKEGREAHVEDELGLDEDELGLDEPDVLTSASIETISRAAYRWAEMKVWLLIKSCL